VADAAVIPIAILASDDDLDYLSRILFSHHTITPVIRTSQPNVLRDHMQRQPVKLLVVCESAARSGMSLIDLIDFYRDLVPVILVSFDPSILNRRDLIAQAIRSGARDVLVVPSGDQLATTIHRIAAPTATILSQEIIGKSSSHDDGSLAGSLEMPARVICCYAPKGGVGVSTLVNAIGIVLLESRRRVLVVDAGYGMSAHADVYLPHYDQPEELVDVVRSYGRAVDVVLLDTHPRLTALTSAALDLATAVIYVMTPDLLSMRGARLFFTLARETGVNLQRYFVVLNQANPELERALNIARGLRGLGIEIAARIPQLPGSAAAVTQAIAGQPQLHALLGRLLPAPA
jgi:cellulose biosynthesis protein BcsQ